MCRCLSYQKKISIIIKYIISARRTLPYTFIQMVKGMLLYANRNISFIYKREKSN